MKLAMSCNPRDSPGYRHRQSRRGGGRPHHQESRTNIDALFLRRLLWLAPKKAVDQLLEDRQCDASKPRKETVANYVLGQRIMCPSNVALEPKIYFKLFITLFVQVEIYPTNSILAKLL